MGIAGLGTPTVPYIPPIESQIAIAAPGETIVEAPEPEPVQLSSKEEYIEYVRTASKEAGVSADTIIAVMNCENKEWDPKLQSRHVKNGVREKSYGLVQIHLPSHPNISYEQATDPKFAIDFIVKAFSEKKQNMWTCYRLLKH